MNGTVRKLGLLLAPLAVLALAGCETPVKTQKLPAITFAHTQPLKLDVAQVDVVVDYKPPMKAPHVGHLFPTPPLTALRTWANDRLRAVGRTGAARLVIKNAAVTETALPQKKGFTATFTKQQAQRYDLAVDAVLEIADGPRRGNAQAQATRFQTLGEDASVNERERAWFDLTEALMADFDREMEKNIRRHLVDWLR